MSNRCCELFLFISYESFYANKSLYIIWGIWFLIYAHTITHSCIKRRGFERGLFEKVRPRAGKIHWPGAVRGLERGGGLDGAPARGAKINTPPGAIDQGGVGDWGGGLPVSEPRMPVKNTRYSSNFARLVRLVCFVCAHFLYLSRCCVYLVDIIGPFGNTFVEERPFFIVLFLWRQKG